MLIIHVYVKVKPESIEAFKQATEKNAAASRKETGIARFDVLQQAGAPEVFLLVEAYRNEAATSAHKQTSHYKEWRDAVASMMAQPRSSSRYLNISPEDSLW